MIITFVDERLQEKKTSVNLCHLKLQAEGCNRFPVYLEINIVVQIYLSMFRPHAIVFHDGKLKLRSVSYMLF